MNMGRCRRRCLIVTTATLLYVLALSWTAAQGGNGGAATGTRNWLQWLSSECRRLERLFSYPAAPDFVTVDAFGKRFRLRETDGCTRIITFFDRRNREAVMRMVESLPEELLDKDGIVFVNVIHPGGISFLVPRGEVIARIRRRIRDCERTYLRRVDPATAEAYAKTMIIWIVDWKRRLARRYHSVSGLINVYLVDESGRIRNLYRSRIPDAARIAREILRLYRESRRVHTRYPSPTISQRQSPPSGGSTSPSPTSTEESTSAR